MHGGGGPHVVGHGYEVEGGVNGQGKLGRPGGEGCVELLLCLDLLLTGLPANYGTYIDDCIATMAEGKAV